MVDAKQVRRVGMLAPMHPELEPIVRKLGLEDERDGEQFRGRAGKVEVVAMLTTMGMVAGADAARRMLELEVDLVMVVGIAGGVSQTSVKIGDVIMPEVVIERSTGRTFTPSWFHDHTRPRSPELWRRPHPRPDRPRRNARSRRHRRRHGDRGRRGRLRGRRSPVGRVPQHQRLRRRGTGRPVAVRDDQSRRHGGRRGDHEVARGEPRQARGAHPPRARLPGRDRSRLRRRDPGLLAL